MSRISPSGMGFSVRHSGEYNSLSKTSVQAKEAYVDDNGEKIILEAGDDGSSATIILDREAAKRMNNRLTEVLE